MGEKLIVGPINKGIRTDRTAFVIDNDSFPTLINAYQWRGRVKRKRGTSFLTRLQRNIGTTNGAGNATITISPVPIATGIVSFTVGTDVFVDPGTTVDPATQTLITNSSGTGTLNRVTGVLTITGSLNLNTAIIYFPSLPVMGLEDLVLQSTQFPGTIAFDTDYSYNIPTSAPYTAYDVSFYKNPAANPMTLPGYTPKGTQTPLNWNGNNYQQFWSTNYQGAFWATNGIDVFFTGATVGMQFRHIFAGPGAGVTVLTPNTARIAVLMHNLVVGDFVFLNEVSPTITGINFQTGYVINVPTINQIDVEFPFATLAGSDVNATGIVQYLTNTAVPGKDCIRWYDGDPTVLNSPNGWVNFSPPLSQFAYSIADLPPAQYYLVGARMILPFKDRLLFFGPVIQSSSSAPIYLQDTIIYSQNGTPYYTISYTNSPNAAVDTPVNPPNSTIGVSYLLVPINQTSVQNAYFEDQTGFGGFITAGLAQAIKTVSGNEDVLILGFDVRQARLVYSGSDIVPFNIFIINSELGSSSTFSAINMDEGVITIGNRGIIITGQTSAQRIDLEIPDQVFEFSLLNNGSERVTAQRDFINEWIYLTYASDENTYIFPTQTLLYNYRDNSWGIFDESYTTYGTFRQSTGRTWATLIAPLTWTSWTDSWISGDSNLFQPNVIAGNQQGFVVFREDDSTNESNSLYIQNIVGSTITCPNHCLNAGDYIVINNALGTIASLVNGKIFSVGAPITTNTFVLNTPIGAGTYLGGGTIQRMYVPLIMTKQFPTAWGLARKTRIGPQQYLFTQTPAGQIQLLIFLSQNDDFAYNNTNIIPDPTSTNNALIYSTLLYTCRESTNLGLTPANTNLQMYNAISTSDGSSSNPQNQIWHRMNTSLIGDTIQIGFTISDSEMRDPTFSNQFTEVELHSFILDISPSQVLS